MNAMDYIQMGMLIFVIPALIVFLICYRKKENKKTDSKIQEYLKCTVPEPIQEYEKGNVKKSYAISFVCGFFSISILDVIVTKFIYIFFDPERIERSIDVALMYSTITLAINAGMFIFSFVGPLLWIAWDKKRLQTKATLVKQPTYVHSTSNLSSSYRNKSAYLLYWDRKAGKLRAKTVMIKQFESEYGELHAGEFVCIAAEEKKAKVKFICALHKIQEYNI